MDKYECLKISNQLCFLLYEVAKEIVKKYKPYLDEMDLTYTQYIAMLVLWENKSMGVKELGRHLYLDSGTLTPLLKKLENKGYITRERSKEDERNLIISITKEGEALKDKAVTVPAKVGKCVCMDAEDAIKLKNQLYGILEEITDI